MSARAFVAHHARDPRWLLVAALVGTIAACTPSIGDKCVLSTDCSTRGDRLCDTAQPDGYCTQFNCQKNSCPDEAACVLFNASIQGCGYDDRAGGYGSRVARSFCVAKCSNNGDCRSGYVCADPHAPPWSGVVLDDDQSKLTCLVPPIDYGVDAGEGGAPLMSPGAPPPVCGVVGPNVGPIDASAPTLGKEAGSPPPLVPDAGAPDADAGDAGDGGDGG
ncbi:MAG: hypothetical protein JWP87_692 [Labilithrix sp.]|nr:hypothetical protein [Labilithrix sp.]